uniref:ribosomal protein S3 n=1 Tax=Pulvinaster venetus TaxID=427767 RepID=UPI001FCDB926|nr:ribosomal protein S3 [Pulvinaster venetus]UNJ18964.1 ribosomal protein S3 [Pulvinaster venetus]
MLKRVHPKGFRLGLFQSWKIDFQCYGKIGNKYVVVLYKKFKINLYLKRFFEKKNIGFGWFSCLIKNEKIFIYCYYTKWLTKFKEKDSFLEKNAISAFRKVFGQWFNVPFNIIFFKTHWLYSPVFLVDWICLNLKNEVSIIRIFSALDKKFMTSKNWFFHPKKCFRGEFLFHLKGIRIICSGKLQKRRRVGKSLRKQLGPLPLQSLNKFFEYDHGVVKTRYGKLGIHVYYFYESVFDFIALNVSS